MSTCSWQTILLQRTSLRWVDPQSIEYIKEALQKNVPCMMVNLGKDPFQEQSFKKLLSQSHISTDTLIFSNLADLRENKKPLPLTYIPFYAQLGRHGNFLKSSSYASLFKPRSLIWLLTAVLFPKNPIFSIFIHCGKPISNQENSPQLRFSLKHMIAQSLRSASGSPLLKPSRFLRFLHQSNASSLFSNNIKPKKRTSLAREIISVCKPIYISIGYILVKPILGKLYRKVHISTDQTQKIRSLMQSDPVIFLPCHKSHLDYLLISFGLYQNQLRTPYIAAGTNLDFFPVGFLFRRMGAYFIRRRISGDKDYASLLSRYIHWLLSKKIPQEFFIEGGRSRNGTLRTFQTGLLSIQIQAFLKQTKLKNLHIVPVMVSYDQVPDDVGIIHEIQGKPKIKESFFSTLRLGNLFKHHYGSAYLSFLEPINVKPEEPLKPYIQNLGKTVLQRISSHTPFSSHSLLASLLLTASSNYSTEKLEQDFNLLSTLALRCKFPYAHLLQNTFKDALEDFKSRGWISLKNNAIQISNEHRIYLDYYMNYCSHHYLGLWSTLLKKHSIDLSILLVLQKQFPYAEIIESQVQREESPLLWKLLNHYVRPYQAHMNIPTTPQANLTHPPEHLVQGKKLRVKQFEKNLSPQQKEAFIKALTQINATPL